MNELINQSINKSINHCSGIRLKISGKSEHQDSQSQVLTIVPGNSDNTQV